MEMGREVLGLGMRDEEWCVEAVTAEEARELLSRNDHDSHGTGGGETRRETGKSSKI
jgi:hypothetical protein